MRPAWVTPWHLLAEFQKPCSGKDPYALWERGYRRDDGFVSIDYREFPLSPAGR